MVRYFAFTVKKKAILSVNGMTGFGRWLLFTGKLVDSCLSPFVAHYSNPVTTKKRPTNPKRLCLQVFG